MKKLIFLLSIGFIAFTSCSKDESNEPIDQESTNLVQIYTMDGASGTWDTIELDPTNGTSNTTTWRNTGNRAATTGVINAPGTNLEWFGSDRNGTITGNGTVEFGPSLLTLETECVMVQGNEAVYGGVITEITNPFGPLAVGNYMYFKVIDNGHGSNGPDQFAPGFIFAPFSQCGIATPDYFVWSFFGTADVQSPGRVDVRN